MKKITLTLFLALATLASVQGQTEERETVSIAQSDYRPQTSWPYLYADFQEAEIHTDRDSSDVVEIGIKALYNIHLRGSLLHYVDKSDGKVHRSVILPSQYIVLGGRKYVVRDGKMMELLLRHGGTELLLQTDGQWQQLFRYQGAAYGIQATASANEGLYNSELAGLDRPSYEVLLHRRADGREILLEDVYYVCKAASLQELQQDKGKLEKASRKAMERLLPSDRHKAFRQFCKENDINFHNGKDLRKAFEWVSER